MWTKEQTEAIQKSGTNIIVSAGAGSGKTAVLTERVVEKLKQGIKINELLILTFTNAAAREMKERIRKKIKDNPEISDNLDYLDSAYITTFDSFSLSLVKKYNYLLNVSKDLQVMDGTIVEVLTKQYLDDIFDEYYVLKPPKFCKLIKDFCLKDDKNLKDAVIKINKALDLKMDKKLYLENYIKENFTPDVISGYVEKFLRLIREEIDSIETNLMYINECNNDTFYNEMVLVLDRLIKAKTYDEILASLNISLPRLPRDSEDLKIYKDSIQESLKVIKGYVRFESEEEIYESFSIMKDYLEVICEIILKLNDKLNSYKEENDLYEFNDIEIMAIKLLQDNANILEEIKNNYHEVCVDEYQDTNDLQEIFIKLIENNNVYMVGDIKQSIYGFRNANPLIFKNKYDKYSGFEDGIKIDLLKNFRSRKEVLEGINEIFSHIMDDTFGGADYIKSHQMQFGNMLYEEEKDDKENYELEIYNYLNEDSEYKNEEIESFIIAKDINNKIANKFKVVDKFTKKLRPCRYDDFCIIMDRGTHFNTYNRVFEYFGIPLQILEDKKLTDEVDLLLIKNLIGLILKIRDNEYDLEFKYYFLSVARSYIYEEDDSKIFHTFKSNDFKNHKLFLKAKEVSDLIKTYDTYESIYKIINEFSFYEKLVKKGNVLESIIRIDYIMDMAKNLNSMGYDLSDFKNYIDVILENKNEIKYKNDNASGSSVKIMNIHKSKGLEFPICYFSGYYKEFNTMDIKERFLFDNTYGLVTPYFKNGIGTSILKDLIKDKYYKDNISEQIRLFYVALTRAKEKMIIVASLGDEKNYVKNIVDYNIRRKYNSFLKMIDSISGNLQKYIKNINVDDLGLTKNYLYLKDINKLDISDTEECIKYIDLDIKSERVIKSHASKEVNKLLSAEEKKNIKYGLKMHKLFEETDFRKDIDSEELKNLILKLNLSESTKIYKEHEFYFEYKNCLYHGIIDLILVDEDVIKVVDYKLKNILDSKYIDQLNIYSEYLKSLFVKPVEIYLYSILDNKLEQIKK